MENRVKKAINNYFSPYYTVFGAYDAGDSYILMIKEKDAKGRGIMDPFYIVDKQSLEINGFVPFENLELFNYARQHPIKY